MITSPTYYIPYRPSADGVHLDVEYLRRFYLDIDIMVLKGRLFRGTYVPYNWPPDLIGDGDSCNLPERALIATAYRIFCKHVSSGERVFSDHGSYLTMAGPANLGIFNGLEARGLWMRHEVCTLTDAERYTCAIALGGRELWLDEVFSLEDFLMEREPQVEVMLVTGPKLPKSWGCAEHDKNYAAFSEVPIQNPDFQGSASVDGDDGATVNEYFYRYCETLKGALQGAKLGLLESVDFSTIVAMANQLSADVGANNAADLFNLIARRLRALDFGDFDPQCRSSLSSVGYLRISAVTR